MVEFTFSGIKKITKAFRGLTAETLEDFLSRKVLRKDFSEIVVYLLIAGYTIVFSYFTILKHHAFRSYAWDLGINNQALWTTLNQRKLFYYTPELYFNPSGSFFGLHFSPILFLVLPVYSIHQTPETLLVFQSFIIALGALPLYWLARDNLNNKLVAVAFSFAYFLYPILQGVNWFDFHVQSFLPLFFFLAMYYLRNEKWIRHYVFIILALAVAESVSLIVLFIGFYTLWVYRNILFTTLKQKTLNDRRVLIPVITIMLAVSWLLITRWIQNTVFPIEPEFSNLYRAVDYWRVLGIQNDPLMMPFHIVLNPLKVFEALTYDAYLKLVFVVLIFGSLLFLPLRSSISLITLAWLGPALLSNYQPYYMLGDHYHAYIIPFIFTAAVVGTKKQIPIPNVAKFGAFARNLLVVGIIFALFASPLSPLLTTLNVPIPHFSEYYLPTVSEHAVTLQKIVEIVPPNASVLTQNNIFPHFSSRLDAYVCPLPRAVEYAPEYMHDYVDQLISKSEYILLDVTTDVYYNASDLIFNSMIFKQNFGSFAEAPAQQIYLYKRGYEGETILFF